MLRHHTPVRPDLARIAHEHGFHFHIIDDEIYWDESRAYRFTLRQIEEQIESPTAELHEMCLDVVDRAVRDARLLERLAIPELYWDAIAQSWKDRDPSLYGRMDFVWTGQGPVKLLEYNADTPTSLYESAYFQWQWLEDARRQGVIPRDADQFNSLQEKLIARLAEIATPEPLYFSCCQESEEDRGTVLYLEDCARQAGLETRFIYIEEIGLGLGGVLTDLDDNVIRQAFKLYPLEWMMRDDNGPLLCKRAERWYEPLWKSILSNKGLLPLLWAQFPGHPNLLPAWFNDDFARERHDVAQALAGYAGYVRKPLFSREGGNVTLFDNADKVLAHEEGDYGNEPVIWQAFQALPRFGDSYTLLGSWIVGDEPAGIGIREDVSLITKDTSRFIPHYIAG
ncbi:glutathionylspermidine synthase family protein [Cronobacter sakazakii]|nr:glutathionylspermidine synthase family protein [Cronobacter sakazakii]ELY4589693.1 glutathionylspermidine synthase family protein [Cronobacter sakazakii]